MQASFLVSFLEGREPVGNLNRCIAKPIAVYRESLRKKGSSCPIEIDRDVESFQVQTRHVRKLCEEYLSGKLDEAEVDYLASAIQLVPEFSFASEAVEQALFAISDPEVNGPLSRSLIVQVLAALD